MDFEFVASEDAQALYVGECKIGTYGRTNGGGQHFTIKDFGNEEDFQKVMHNTPPNTPVVIMAGIGSDSVIPGWHLMLKKASDGARTGPQMKLEFPMLDDESYSTIQFLKEQDEPITLFMFQGEILIEEKQEKGPHGKFAAQLFRSQLFKMPEFWRLVGSEDSYERWLRQQKCAVTGRTHKDPDTGIEKCEVAHVRSVNWGAGIAKKPAYFAIPLHHDQHEMQHNKGMGYLWRSAHYGNRYLAPELGFPVHSEMDAIKGWFVHLAHKYIKLWIKYSIKKHLGVRSLSDVSEEMFEKYLQDINAHDMIRFL